MQAEPVKKQCKYFDNNLLVPKEISQDEVDDPDVQRNLFSLYYCTQRFKEINEKIKKFQAKKQRIPRNLQTDLLKVFIFTNKA